MKRKNTGLKFEELVEQRCRLYERQGIAKIHRTSPGTKMVPDGHGKWKLVYAKNNPWLDFAGMFAGMFGHWMVVIECKDIKANRLPLRAKNEGSGLTSEQIGTIMGFYEHDAIVFVLWRRGTEIRRFMGNHILNCISNNKKSIQWEMGEEVEDMDFLKGVL